MDANWLVVADEVRAAVADGRPVVALESTLIAHGLPWPANLETARESEAAIREQGAVPATIAVLGGVPTVGLTAAQLEEIATREGVWKASRRDLAAAVALKKHAATTVSATMALARAAGIRVFATGGIGGAHRESDFDISADLTELARTPVLVVCSGAKSILDLPRTLEILETYAVPVLGYQTEQFPTFYTAGAVGAVARVESPAEAAAVFAAHVRMGGGGGAVLAQPCPEAVAISAEEFNLALNEAEIDATAEGIAGPQLTPFLLSRLAELTQGKTLAANRTLIVNNATLAAQVAKELL
ncbi:pseudouridine-5'-phosphate glycosidase [Limnoglobus roseus]|uniref:Pseudouridine-5'-phosphate glycosidase n=1 Tax=Limnoglobus roseus TaxID=2598579 RepID=A0A5C1A7U3_9BACT|nr:pseudouridine-5'-phosphate glycosidase [Limnoglobus roseus]QEL13922.1 pseudouridine-5'-phosphate glycosidase [Limnoglobus roseus]